MAFGEATSEAELSVEEDGDPATDADVDIGRRGNPGNQEEANSDEFVDDQEEAFSDGDSETEFG